MARNELPGDLEGKCWMCGKQLVIGDWCVMCWREVLKYRNEQ